MKWGTITIRNTNSYNIQIYIELYEDGTVWMTNSEIASSIWIVPCLMFIFLQYFDFELIESRKVIADINSNHLSTFCIQTFSLLIKELGTIFKNILLPHKKTSFRKQYIEY